MVPRIGQTEAISMVLVSGIVISLVGAAYFWGMPMIDKRSAATEFTSAANMMDSINEKIISIASSGGGSVELDLSKPLTLVPYGAMGVENNTIKTSFGINQPIIYPLAEGGAVYVGASSFSETSSSGTFGQSAPGVISATQEKGERAYVMNMALRYRELKTSTAPAKSYLIKLCGEADPGCTSTYTGSSSARFTFRGTETVPMQGSPDLVVTKIGVSLQ